MVFTYFRARPPVADLGGKSKLGVLWIVFVFKLIEKKMKEGEAEQEGKERETGRNGGRASHLACKDSLSRCLQLNGSGCSRLKLGVRNPIWIYHVV